ncbi:MAG TPA: hypothetical protein VNL14_03980 [Candidatus Acidoferrales bacterium]|nr:hypothetical protein [Candidatus Acidoferrales bacterium]
MAAGTETPVGRVTHYYSHLNVGIVELTDGDLNLGDTIHIKGSHTDFTQTVDSMQIEHQNVTHADKGKLVGIMVREKVRENDRVFKV